MQFSDIYARDEQIVNTGSTYRSLVKDAIQWGLDIISNSWNWPYLMQEYFITLVAPYETGTVSVTNNSTTVTGSGTSWDTTWTNRKIRIGEEQAYYRIKSVDSTTTLTLEAPYQGTTATGEDYSIYKDEYRLAPNINKYKVMRQIENTIPLLDMGASAFDLIEPTSNSSGSPRISVSAGSRRDTYSTGTVTGTQNSRTLTGTNTVWTSVEGLGRGSRITLNATSVYTVRSVDSDTQITIYEMLSAAVTGVSYEVLLNNIILQVFEIPDQVENIYYRAQRVPAVLYNDYDIPDLPDDWHWLLVEAGLSKLWEIKDKAEARAKKQEFFGGIDLMKKAIGNVSQSTLYPRNSISYILERAPYGGRYPSSYGVPFTV